MNALNSVSISKIGRCPPRWHTIFEMLVIYGPSGGVFHIAALDARAGVINKYCDAKWHPRKRLAGADGSAPRVHRGHNKRKRGETLTKTNARLSVGRLMNRVATLLETSTKKKKGTLKKVRFFSFLFFFHEVEMTKRAGGAANLSRTRGNNIRIIRRSCVIVNQKCSSLLAFRGPSKRQGNASVLIGSRHVYGAVVRD